MKVKLPNNAFYDRFLAELDKLMSAKGLKQNKMSLCDCHILWESCGEILAGKEAETITRSVAEWIKRLGFLVAECGVGWKIALPDEMKKGIVIQK